MEQIALLALKLPFHLKSQPLNLLFQPLSSTELRLRRVISLKVVLSIMSSMSRAKVFGPSPVAIDLYVDLLNPLNQMDIYFKEGSLPLGISPILSGESGDMYVTVHLYSDQAFFAIESVDCNLCSKITYDVLATKKILLNPFC